MKRPGTLDRVTFASFLLHNPIVETKMTISLLLTGHASPTQKRLELKALKRGAGRITGRTMGDTTYKNALFRLRPRAHGTMGHIRANFLNLDTCAWE